jgi:hypothetical protein
MIVGGDMCHPRQRTLAKLVHMMCVFRDENECMREKLFFRSTIGHVR